MKITWMSRFTENKKGETFERKIPGDFNEVYL